METVAKPGYGKRTYVDQILQDNGDHLKNLKLSSKQTDYNGITTNYRLKKLEVKKYFFSSAPTKQIIKKCQMLCRILRKWSRRT